MPHYVYVCESCNTMVDIFRRIADIDAPVEEPCACDTPTWRRTIQAPMVMQAAVPDGQRKFTTLREQQKLTKDKAKARETGDRASEKKLDREIKKLNS